jgi:hypothetical protein
MDPAIRESLLKRLEAYLDEFDAAEAPEADVAERATATRMASDGAREAADEEARDLFSVFVEIAAARNEVLAQSRIVKDALDQFRAVFETLQTTNAALDRELEQAHQRARAGPHPPAAAADRHHRRQGSSRRRARGRSAGSSAAAVAAMAIDRCRPRSVAGGHGDDASAARSRAGGPPCHPDPSPSAARLRRLSRGWSRPGTPRPWRRGG